METGNNSKNNDLKIDLYPENQARYEFPKESVKHIITKGTLGHSFDENQNLAF